jgi:hypothetical protein
MTGRQEHAEHVDFETLNDYVDGRLDDRVTLLIDKHLSGCEPCSLELASLRSLVAATRALPRAVLPEDDLWTDLKASIDRRKDIVLPASTSVSVPDRHGSIHEGSTWRRRTFLAAAAVVLVVLSSTITTLVLRSTGTTTVVEHSPDGGGSGSDHGALPPLPGSFQVADGQYTRTIEELRLAVAARRDQLDPATVRTVDRSLAVVDSAIAEARAALLADPNNRTLVDLLSASYQRKLDLLRRTSELSSRT